VIGQDIDGTIPQSPEFFGRDVDSRPFIIIVWRNHGRS
jgi:hypothetical protein